MFLNRKYSVFDFLWYNILIVNSAPITKKNLKPT